MAGKKELYNAIVTGLRADTGVGSLVALTGYTTSNMSISRSNPPIKGKAKFLGAHVPMSVPLIEDGVTQWQRSTLDLWCIAKTELTAIEIADRIETLTHPTDNRDYWDFSDANIRTKRTEFVSRRGAEKDEDTEAWSVLIRLEIIWLNLPCP